MTPSPGTGSRAPLRSAIVLRVQEQSCEVLAGGRLLARYAQAFPSPRTERVSPGHLVALATASDGTAVVVWRWYDAVVLGEEAGLIRLWEPAHGEVVAQPRPSEQVRQIGSRAYLSAGLPGAEWWVAGAATARPEEAAVELGEVERFLDAHDAWDETL